MKSRDLTFSPQESDLRYLIESIWNTQSALSAQNDLYDLVFIRWNKHEEWSPWNCILLTKEEASAHEKLENVTEVCSLKGTRGSGGGGCFKSGLGLGLGKSLG